MNDTPRNAVLEEYSRQLKMPTFASNYAPLARQAAEEGWPYEDYLRELLETEVLARQENAARRRIREARFPENKNLDQIDWKAMNGVSRPKILELASGQFIEDAEDVVIAGPVGTGKTHLAIALGI